MSEPGFESVLPPLLAITLAITTRRVFSSLALGLWLGQGLITGGPLTGLAGAIEACVKVFGDAGNTRVIMFSALVGALIALTQRSGGVEGFAAWLARHGRVTTPRRAALLSMGIGVLVFVESSITSLVNGAVCRPIFDRLRMSREKLAYLCDATAAPVCILIPLNAWGAYITRLLGQEGYADPVSLLIATMPYNLYSILAVLLALGIALTGRDFGPMAAAERRARETGQVVREGGTPMLADAVASLPPAPGAPRRARDFLVPVGAMVLMMPIGLAVTGNGDLTAGSGSTAVLWGVLLGVGLSAGSLLARRVLSSREVGEVLLQGVGGLLPLALLMFLAFALGDTARALGTGRYVALAASGAVPFALLPTVLFAVACGISFATGTSWGTFAIMIPIAAPLAAAHPGSDALLLGAVLGGGVFGDHCSPISDTTLVASMAAGSDHVDHVNTQLPYALAAAVVAGVIYVGLAALR